MKNILTLWLLVFLVLHQSCSKQEDDLISQNCEIGCTEIIGKIMTDAGTVPIRNLKLTVKWDNIGHLKPGIVRTKASTRTDEKGNFYLKFLIRDDELQEGGFRLVYEIDTKKFIVRPVDQIGLYGIGRDTILKVEHNIPQKAFLNLSVLNLDELQQNDYISANFSYLIPLEFSQSFSGTSIGWDKESNNNKTIEVAGNQPISISIIRQKNDVSTIENDTITLAAGTTSTYTINYNN